MLERNRTGHAVLLCSSELMSVFCAITSMPELDDRVMVMRLFLLLDLKWVDFNVFYFISPLYSSVNI